MTMSFCHICFRYLTIMLIITSCWNLGEGTLDYELLQSSDEKNNQSTTLISKAQKPYSSDHSRKLLVQGSCSDRDISISQSKDSTPGIPQFIVQIINTCSVSECALSDIHLHCGWFASARLVNPTIFKRLSYDDCLVNGGKTLKNSEIIRFTYSNSFMYTLAFKTAKSNCK